MNEPAVFAGLFLAFHVAALHAASIAPTTPFQFRFPRPAAFRFEVAGSNRWLVARPDNGSANFFAFGSRLVVQLESPEDLPRLMAGHNLTFSRSVAPGVFILQAPNALAAAREAQRLAALPEVLASYPVVRRQASLHGPYAPQPAEAQQSPGFTLQWPLENRNADGSRAGVDMNVRAAWPHTLGRGVTLAIADTGIEMAHEELSNKPAGAPHYNFVLQNFDARPIGASALVAHGTEVAGLAAADINHARSVLQALNNDTNAGPADWTYYTTHDFFESSAGHWTAYFSDERADNTDSVQQVSLTVQGAPITDTDHDGLDDGWDLAHFGNLNQGPRDDPNRDGDSNMREELMGADPNAPAAPFSLNLSPWNSRLARLSWPASPYYHYEIRGGTNAGALDLAANVPGGFPETEWFTPDTGLPQEFFQARAAANP